MWTTLVDFDDADSVADWKTVDDVVMGGRSESSVSWVDAPLSQLDRAGWLRFEGEVSLENNGGFCSARFEEDDRGAPGVETLRLRVRGDGHRYTFTVRTRHTPSSASWRLPFDPPEDEWRAIDLPVADFELWRRGTRLEVEDSLNPAGTTSFGLLISDRQEGPFRLDLARIAGA